MGDSNIDMENATIPLQEDPPPILSSAIREVFHVFANMLDIHSFMKLAMTSKETYTRCMEDRGIRINLDEKEVSISKVDGFRTFSFHSFDIADNHIEKYLEKLRQLKCNVSLKKIHFQGPENNDNSIMETRCYLEEIGVKKIESLEIDRDFTVANPISFITDYHLKNVEINSMLTDDVLGSLLQLKLESFSYSGSSIQGDMLLQVDSPIPELKLRTMQLSADVLTQILWKIQTGALKKLTIGHYSVPWNDFTDVEHDHEGDLPDDRPLLISTHYFYGNKWILHWDGALTKCRVNDKDRSCEFSKCEPDDLPPVLLAKEKAHKALAEKCDRVDCTKSHFLSFFDGMLVVDSSHEGPFPEERPLLCKGDDGEAYYLLNKDGSLDVFLWLGHVELWGSYDMEKTWPEYGDHTALLKYILKRRMEKGAKKGFLSCRDEKQCRKVFKGFVTLPHNFKGQLPKNRPLLFKKAGQRIILYEDGSLIQYKFDDGYDIHIEPCPAWNRPEIMKLSSAKLMETILEAPLEEFAYNINYDVFCEAFEDFEILTFHAFGDLSDDRPLVFKKTERDHNDEIIDQRWVLLEDGDVRKCEWEDGEATLSRGDPSEFPFILTKSLVKAFFEGNAVNTELGFFIERDVLNQCLEDCCPVSYNCVNSNLLSGSRPLIFKKSEVKHTCKDKSEDGDCACVDEILHLCFVSDDEEVIHITWGAKKDRFLSFNKKPDPVVLPRLLKNKKYLEYLLKSEWYDSKMKWYGSIEDFVSYFEGHRMVEFKHEGRLPKTRPLVFKQIRDSLGYEGKPPVFWFLREDGQVIECERYSSHTLLTIDPDYGKPPAISKC